MPVFLLLLGIVLAGVGLFLVGFSIPFRDFSLGNTLIVSGAVGIVGGIVVIAISATLRELRKISRQLEAGAVAPRPASATSVAAAPPPVRSAPASAPTPAAAPPRQPPKPAPVVNTARSQRAEPRLDGPAEMTSPEPPMPQAPTIADITSERPSRGLFASIRGRSQATPQREPAATPSAKPAPAPVPRAAPPAAPPAEAEHDPLPPPPRSGHPDRPPFHPEPEAGSEASSLPRSPSLAALAARTAARLDLPRQVPDLPRSADAEPEDPPEYAPPPYEPPPERPARNMFDSVWPGESKGADRSADGESNAPQKPAPEILKSGVIDGMAYTLYTDGSIEAQLPQGTLRFTSIDDLRAHLERGN